MIEQSRNRYAKAYKNEVLTRENKWLIFVFEDRSKKYHEC